MNQQQIVEFAASCLACPSDDVALSSVSGGDINQCFRATSADGSHLFVKANTQGQLLRCELNALQKMGDLGAEYYPGGLAFADTDDGGGILAMEFLAMQPLTGATAAQAAKALYQQHQIHHTRYGWYENGYIGYSRQPNEWADRWSIFFTERRLRPQLKQAVERGLRRSLVKRIERIIDEFAQCINEADIRPSLVHGDLWSGNLAYVVQTQSPTFYDPAPYFGDPEVDIAMTMLFGRFSDEFYQRYRAMQPEPLDFQYRASVYNLYHALNHVNLFGLTYEPLVASLCESASESSVNR